LNGTGAAEFVDPLLHMMDQLFVLPVGIGQTKAWKSWMKWQIFLPKKANSLC
jgi:hypothetical protein